MFYFCYSRNSSNVLKSIFNYISIYFFKKISQLKELRDYNSKLLFASATKIGGGTTNVLNCYFSKKKKTLWYLPLRVCICLLFSRKARKTHTDQSIIQAFLFCLKRNVSQTFKSSSCKKVFPNAYIIDKTCFNEFFLVYLTTGRHYFLYKFSITRMFGAIAMLLRSFKEVF